MGETDQNGLLTGLLRSEEFECVKGRSKHTDMDVGDDIPRHYLSVRDEERTTAHERVR